MSLSERALSALKELGLQTVNIAVTTREFAK
jgi:hypothetical protein